MSNVAKSTSSITPTTAISVDSLPAVGHDGMPVVTTELLARLYGAEVKHIQNNYLRNAERFTIGKHYFKLEGIELKVFKNKSSLRGLVASRAKHLILWTERGAARHAKMLETDQAWEVFEKLEDCYFNKVEQQKTKTRQSTATQLTPLRQTAERLIATGLGKIYPDIWKLVHSRFDIEHIHQLQPHQVGEAIEYLNAIEGEYLGRETLPSDVNNLQFTDDELCSLSWLWLVADKMRSHAEITYPALRQLESKHAGAAYDISCEFNHWLRNTMQILIRETDHIGKSNRLVACEPALMHLRDHQWSTARK
ncbi:TPA: ORF6N domain-containing protein [Yersinia enterocolitica]|nr:ORF6N domain-containing protein [Yersinia enterocolitica]HEB0976874.1 ORF6N domain-containing protein [Yersinia enterocolitica]